jgi:hypothetical protein
LFFRYFGAVDLSGGREDDLPVAVKEFAPTHRFFRRIGLLLAEARGPHDGPGNVTEEPGFAKRAQTAADLVEGGFRMEVTPPEIGGGSR